MLSIMEWKWGELVVVASLTVRDGSGRCFQFVFLINSMINVQPETGSGQSAGNGRYKQLLFEFNPWERYKNCNDAVMILHNWYLQSPQRFPRAIDYSLHFWEAHILGINQALINLFFLCGAYKVDNNRCSLWTLSQWRHWRCWVISPGSLSVERITSVLSIGGRGGGPLGAH